MVTLWSPRPEQWSHGRTGPGQAALGLWTSGGMGGPRPDAPRGAQGPGHSNVGRGRPAPGPGTGASSAAAGEAARGGGVLLPGAGPGPGSTVLTQNLQAEAQPRWGHDTHSQRRAGGRTISQTPTRLGRPPRLQTEDGWGARRGSEPVGHVPPSAQRARAALMCSRPGGWAGETATHPPGAAAGHSCAGRRGRQRPPPPPGEGQQGSAGSGACDVCSPAPMSPICKAGDAHHGAGGAGTYAGEGNTCAHRV